MADNRYPPGYIPLTIHEIGGSQHMKSNGVQRPPRERSGNGDSYEGRSDDGGRRSNGRAGGRSSNGGGRRNPRRGGHDGGQNGNGNGNTGTYGGGYGAGNGPRRSADRGPRSEGGQFGEERGPSEERAPVGQGRAPAASDNDSGDEDLE